ncbi:phosphopantetheine-binding protein [Paenibacillus filicis]|uniref:Phosphopantetheine-binding protein n=1 Tax=Paenibacillus gyeongsangnamensis TaxID=3388067 RepID=A0ABT4QIZ8_9BACL|nr:phosphopantetheine-binding protein [Paenibacillus filicis]MCZ8516856.1 phosphopantetheine-binding protein [Paenibacillus filicis]
MMRLEEMGETVLSIIENKMNFKMDRSLINGETVLGVEGMGLDSIAIISLSNHLEREYGISLTDDEIAVFHGMNLNDICHLILEKNKNEV